MLPFPAKIPVCPLQNVKNKIFKIYLLNVDKNDILAPSRFA